MGNGERIDSSNRYALSPLWGALPGESLPLTDIVICPRGPFVSQPHLCLAAIDEPTRPLRGHPSSTRKGGALQHAYRFPHFRHGCVSAEQASIIPSVSLSWPGKVFHQRPSAAVPSLPFQALWASFPEGKPIPSAWPAVEALSRFESFRLVWAFQTRLGRIPIYICAASAAHLPDSPDIPGNPDIPETKVIEG